MVCFFSAPRSSVRNFCENCVFSYCYSSHIERGIDVWQHSVVHLATNYNTHSFNSPLQNKLILTLTEDINIQSEPERLDENQSSEKKFQILPDFQLNFSNASDFDTIFSQRVRFRFKDFTTR